MFFQDLILWRLSGTILWAVLLSFFAEIAIGSALSILSANDSFGFFGLRGVVLIGLQVLVHVRDHNVITRLCMTRN